MKKTKRRNKRLKESREQQKEVGGNGDQTLQDKN